MDAVGWSVCRLLRSGREMSVWIVDQITVADGLIDHFGEKMRQLRGHMGGESSRR